MTKRAKPGDVVELGTPTGAVYLHYLGKHQKYGDGVTVCPVERTRGVKPDEDLFRDGYVTFFPVNAAVNRGVASVVGHLPSPGIPTRMRRAGARSANRVETWIIDDGVTRLVKKTLSASELKLPIAAIWNIEYLVQRVSEGWRPEAEGQVE